jgi:5-formyltetrahydrofolate cyclo-ligase
VSDPGYVKGTDQAKQAIRERVWSKLEAAGVVEPGVAGYIPNFQGAAKAAGRLAQLPVRVLALAQGKLVYMAAPKLATPEPFYVLDPATLSVSPAEAAEREIAARIAPMASVAAMQAIDLVVVGSVAVNEKGARLGKGAGYSDIELGLLIEAGLVTERTTICATVHELQVLDEELPELPHDFRVDVIATPERIIRCSEPQRPETIDWSGLSAGQIEAIPVLKARAGRQP